VEEGSTYVLGQGIKEFNEITWFISIFGVEDESHRSKSNIIEGVL